MADVDDLNLQRRFDVVVMLDALHHTARQTRVVANVAHHLRRGGWALFGEPSWLHVLSPDARRVSRETGGPNAALRFAGSDAICEPPDLTAQLREEARVWSS